MLSQLSLDELLHICKSLDAKDVLRLQCVAKGFCLGEASWRELAKCKFQATTEVTLPEDRICASIPDLKRLRLACDVTPSCQMMVDVFQSIWEDDLDKFLYLLYTVPQLWSNDPWHSSGSYMFAATRKVGRFYYRPPKTGIALEYGMFIQEEDMESVVISEDVWKWCCIDKGYSCCIDKGYEPPLRRRLRILNVKGLLRVVMSKAFPYCSLGLRRNIRPLKIYHYLKMNKLL